MSGSSVESHASGREHRRPEGRVGMAGLQSNTDAILVAIPMVGAMFAYFFRLDESFSRFRKLPEKGHQLSGWDEDGHPICVEPDGKLVRAPRVRSRDLIGGPGTFSK